jgi:cysteinyl-tRNA synthetase
VKLQKFRGTVCLHQYACQEGYKHSNLNAARQVMSLLYNAVQPIRTTVETKKKRKRKICSVEACTSQARKDGFCYSHRVKVTS